jgi:hypothetical protein
MYRLVKLYNGATPTSAAVSKVSTGTTLKTLLQIAPPSTLNLRVVEWGISFDGSSAATPIQCELVETSGAATVTALSSADAVLLNDPGGLGTQLTFGTTSTGITASGEGTPSTSRLLDYQLVAPTNQYVIQYPLGHEPLVQASKFLRVRVTAGASVGAICYVVWKEA